MCLLYFMFVVNIDVFMWKAKDFHVVELVKVIYYNDVSIIQSFAVVLEGLIYRTGDDCIIFSEHSFLVVHISIWHFFNCVCSRARFPVLRKQNLNISLHYNVWKMIGIWCEESENNWGTAVMLKWLQLGSMMCWVKWQCNEFRHLFECNSEQCKMYEFIDIPRVLISGLCKGSRV
jgi:hypothetical protein